MSCKPNAERRELALKSYAEVQPDFAGGNGISAQGKVNGVNDTLGPPNDSGLKGIAPCKGRTSRIGATPPRHKRANRGKMREIQHVYALVERYAHGITRHVMRPIYARVCRGGEMREIQMYMHWWNDGHMGIMQPCNAPNLRPFCRGVLPLFRHIALTGRDTF